jgi:spore coat polysaccharide biosynthesis protein SpsF
MQRVLIGIQARSGSTRLPRKAFELISGKMMLDRVIDSCKKAAPRINNSNGGALCAKIVVLTPTGDPVAREFKSRCEVFEGPEHDVLRRYALAAEKFDPAFIVRITGDCPMIPPPVISKLVSMAYINCYDYVSNVDERFRTALDGADCEVISRRLLSAMDELAVSDFDREHVTPLARRSPPEWAKIGCVVNDFDHSHLKLSVDTPEDLERVRTAYEKASEKHRQAVLTFGSTAVHRL